MKLGQGFTKIINPNMQITKRFISLTATQRERTLPLGCPHFWLGVSLWRNTWQGMWRSWPDQGNPAMLGHQWPSLALQTSHAPSCRSAHGHNPVHSRERNVFNFYLLKTFLIQICYYSICSVAQCDVHSNLLLWPPEYRGHLLNVASHWRSQHKLLHNIKTCILRPPIP